MQHNLLSADGKAKPYIHGEITNAIASVNLDLTNISRIENIDEEESHILEDYDLVSSEEIDRYLKKEGIK